MIDNANRSLKVFLCHASGDKPVVQKLYSRLVNDGVDAWLDKEKLIPGQNWQIEIPKAVRNSDIVLVCLSTQSVNKEGFVQKEIKIALDAADEKPEGTIFIIPARLENCNVPERISQFHWVDLFADNGYEWLMKALQLRANTIGVVFKHITNPDPHKNYKQKEKSSEQKPQTNNSARLETKNINSQATASGVITGIFYQKNMKESFSVLQFYEDRKVISASIGTKDLYVSWPTISKWFHHDYSDSGSYRLIGNNLTFSITFSNGTIDYSGEYLDDKLILSIYSHINGYQAKNQEYTRLKI